MGDKKNETIEFRGKMYRLVGMDGVIKEGALRRIGFDGVLRPVKGLSAFGSKPSDFASGLVFYNPVETKKEDKIRNINGKKYREIGQYETIEKGALFRFSSGGTAIIYDQSIVGEKPCDFSGDRVFLNPVKTKKSKIEYVEYIGHRRLDSSYSIKEDYVERILIKSFAGKKWVKVEFVGGLVSVESAYELINMDTVVSLGIMKS